jgi:hypothetical protein
MADCNLSPGLGGAAQQERIEGRPVDIEPSSWKLNGRVVGEMEQTAGDLRAYPRLWR